MDTVLVLDHYILFFLFQLLKNLKDLNKYKNKVLNETTLSFHTIKELVRQFSMYTDIKLITYFVKASAAHIK